MPEFYNRFQGRNDLMEYAKVWPDPTITPTLAQCPPGTALQGGCLGQRHEAGTDTHAWRLNLCPGYYPPPRNTCSLGRLRRGVVTARGNSQGSPQSAKQEGDGPPLLPVPAATSAVCVTQGTGGRGAGHSCSVPLRYLIVPSAFPGTGRCSEGQRQTKTFVAPALLKYKLQ